MIQARMCTQGRGNGCVGANVVASSSDLVMGSYGDYCARGYDTKLSIQLGKSAENTVPGIKSWA